MQIEIMFPRTLPSYVRFPTSIAHLKLQNSINNLGASIITCRLRELFIETNNSRVQRRYNNLALTAKKKKDELITPSPTADQESNGSNFQ